MSQQEKFRWVEDLLDKDSRVMGVYLALLCLRFFRGEENYPIAPNASELFYSPDFRKVYIQYFGGKPEAVEATEAGRTFIERLFSNEKEALNSLSRNRILEQIEAAFYQKFLSSFIKYVELDQIPAEFRNIMQKFLYNLAAGFYGAKTAAGSVATYLWDDDLMRYEGLSSENARKLREYLTLCKLAFAYYTRSGYLHIFPAVTLSNEVITKLVEAPQPEAPEVEPTITPLVSKAFIGVKPSREVLEGITAKVLEDLGFKSYTNAKLPSRGGEVEVDVWGFKNIGDLQFRVYISCKNWDKGVDRQVVDQEFGRTLQLTQVPHLRILIAKELTDPARKAALDDGFFIIELGEKALVENAQEVQELISGKLRYIFTAIALEKLRDIAEKIRSIAREVEELYRT